MSATVQQVQRPEPVRWYRHPETGRLTRAALTTAERWTLSYLCHRAERIAKDNRAYDRFRAHMHAQGQP